MPHLFTLQGRGNCGKSDTLIHMFHLVENKYPDAKVQALHKGNKDITILMRGVNGMIVGIESQGDPNSRLQQSLTDFALAKCDIIFCACRTSGMTVGWVNALSPVYDIHFIKQTQVGSNHSASNAATAASLMQKAGI